jgi:hypothetical protein
MEEKYISMADAAKLCSYEQDYLSLLARRGDLRAEKKGRNWFTKVEWLNAYLEAKKPNEIITPETILKTKEKAVPEKVDGVKKRDYKNLGKIWILSAIVILIVAVFAYQYIFQKIAKLEKNSQNNVFVPEEITKVPNESGGYDVYGSGKIKMGEEGAVSP